MSRQLRKRKIVAQVREPEQEVEVVNMPEPVDVIPDPPIPEEILPTPVRTIQELMLRTTRKAKKYIFK